MIKVKEVTGKQLERLRNKEGWSKSDVARKLGIKTVSTYANWEYGIRQPDHEMLIKIADLYNVSTDFLLGREVEKSNLSLAFEDGGESLTPDEEEHLEAELKKYRELKKRFMSEKNRDNS